MEIPLVAPSEATPKTATLGQLVAASAQVVEPMTAKAAQIVIDEKRCSTSQLQQQLGIGYNKAARVVECLEAIGIVNAPDHVGQRDVLATELPKDLAKAAKAQSDARLPMKETPADEAVRDGVFRVAAGELRSFIERFERLGTEKKEISEQMKGVMAEAKGRGYDTKILRKVIALRKRDKDDIAEEEAVLDMYKEALGM